MSDTETLDWVIRELRIYQDWKTPMSPAGGRWLLNEIHHRRGEQRKPAVSPPPSSVKIDASDPQWREKMIADLLNSDFKPEYQHFWRCAHYPVATANFYGRLKSCAHGCSTDAYWP